MPRDSSGNYTLPYNPVAYGTAISSSWANDTAADIATALTDSLSRSGKGSTNAAMKCADGTVGLPGISFVDEAGSGWYRFGSNDLRFSISGNGSLRFVDDSATAAGSRNPVLVFNGTSWQPILKGDVSEMPTFNGFTTSGELTVDAGGLDIDAGGLTVSAGGIDITGNTTVTGTATAGTVNGAPSVAAGIINYAASAVTVASNSVGVASASRLSAGVYLVTFVSSLLSAFDTWPVCFVQLTEPGASSKNVECVTEQVSTNTIRVRIEQIGSGAVDRDIAVIAYLEV
jgi:hypothetical protein